MALEFFAYAVEGDSTADADMITFVTQPTTRPVYLPFGQMFRGGDGQPMFAGAPTLTLHWDALTFDADTDDSALPSNVAGVKKFYEDWRRARDDRGQRYTVNLLNLVTNTWQKLKCVIPWVNWSGKEYGAAIVNFEITLVAIGVDFDTAPAWGEVSAPAYSEDPITLGDELVGAYGYGVYGRGIYGVGSVN
jgi:hypothetical protein